MTFIPYETPDRPPPEFPDRRTGLRAAGTVAIIVGMCIATVGLLMPVVYLLPDDPGEARRPAGEVAGDVLICAGAAAFCIWAGIGSLKFRRWVRPLMLAVGWTWLVVDVLFLLFFVPSLLKSIQAARAASSGGQTAGAFAGGIALTGCFVLVLYTLLPALAVAFYHRRGVRETLAHYDREPRWTDNSPVPVLALSLWLVVLAAATAAVSLARPVFPFFGRALVGLPATAACLVVALVLAWLARAAFRRRLAAWWAVMAALVLYVASYVITALAGDLPGAYRRAGYTAEELEGGAYGISDQSAMLWFALFWGSALCYLLYVRRFFTATASGDSSGPLRVIPAPPP